MEFSQWLEKEMGELDITAYRLSKLSGIHQTTIKNLLLGAKPQAETEQKIIRALEGLKRDEKIPASKPETGKDETIQSLVDEIENMSPAERLLLQEWIKKIKEARP